VLAGSKNRIAERNHERLAFKSDARLADHAKRDGGPDTVAILVGNVKVWVPTRARATLAPFTAIAHRHAVHGVRGQPPGGIRRVLTHSPSPFFSEK
jgi:hypothetical protein